MSGISSWFGAKSSEDSLESEQQDIAAAELADVRKDEQLETVPEETVETELATSMEPEFVSEQRLSPDERERKQVLQRLRSDIGYFNEELRRNELFAVKTRESLKTFKDFIEDADLETGQVAILKREIDEKETTIAALESRLGDLEAASAEKDTLLLAEGNRVNELRELVESIRQEKNELAEFSDNARNSIRNLTRERDQLEGRSNVLTNQVADLTAEKRVLEESRARLDQESAEQLEENAQLEKQVEELDANLTRIIAQRDKMKADLHNLGDVKLKQKAEILELRSSNDALREELNSKDRHSADRLRNREEEIFSLKSEIDRLHSQISVRTQMFNQAQNEMNSAKAMAKVAGDTAREIEERLVRVNVAQEADQKNLMLANEEVSELNARYARILQELEDVKSENERLRQFQKIYTERSARASLLGLDEKEQLAEEIRAAEVEKATKGRLQ